MIIIDLFSFDMTIYIKTQYLQTNKKQHCLGRANLEWLDEEKENVGIN